MGFSPCGFSLPNEPLPFGQLEMNHLLPEGWVLQQKGFWASKVMVYTLDLEDYRGDKNSLD